MWRLLLFCVLYIESVHSARILAVVPTPSFSHQVFFRPIWKELAKRGHDLTLVTTDPMRDSTLPNLKEIDISSSYKMWKEDFNITEIFQEAKYNPFKMITRFTELLNSLFEHQINHPEIQTMLKNETEHFDLFIVEYLYPAMYGFAHTFKCPYIGVTSLDLPTFAHGMLGNPIHPVLYPDSMFTLGEELTFFHRLQSTVMVFLMSMFGNLFQLDEALMNQHFGSNFPNTVDLMKNVSLVLANIDPTYNKRPLGPAVIPIGGGTHVATSSKPLPKDLQHFLDTATEGVIYFSLGTNVNETDVNPRLRQAFISTFKKVPYKVLWKFGVDVPEVSENVKIVKWMSQQDVLKHPNIKCFITQGGLQSTEESIFNNVPMIGIPFIADQEMNVKTIQNHGLGIALDKDSLTEELLTETIYEVIKNPKYRNKVTEYSRLSRDQPLTGIEKAVWWIEYVLRHNGAEHLRNPAMDVPFYQWLMLDILLFTITCLYLLKVILCALMSCVSKLFFSTKQKID